MGEAQEHTNTGVKVPTKQNFSSIINFFFHHLHLLFYRNEGEGSYGGSCFALIFPFWIISRIG